MTFVKGKSGNPSGRKAMDPKIKTLIQEAGVRAAEIMKETLDDPTAFGKDGWVPVRDQYKVLDVAMNRAFGKAENLSVSHTHKHGGEIEHKKVEQIAKPVVVDVELPEKRRDVVDAEVIEERKAAR